MTASSKRRHELAVMAEQCTGRGRDGVVCAAAPLAALAGAAALRDGGNAFDAAVAAALAETVLLPPKCGFGGDLVAIVARRSGADRPEALIAVGGAAGGPRRRRPRRRVARRRARLGRSARRGRRLRGARRARPCSVGSGSRRRAIATGASTASPGPRCAPACPTQAAALVAEMNPDGCVVLPGRRADRARRDRAQLPGLADVLARVGRPRRRMLDGPVGDAIVDAVRSRGGVLDRPTTSSSPRAEWVAVRHSGRSAAGSCGRRRRRRTARRCSTRSTRTRGRRPAPASTAT